MPGKYQYDVEIKSNVTKLLTDMKEVQDRLDTVEGKEYKVKLNIDEKKLSSVISNLEKMLNSLSKGSNDFKQFENLSKQLTTITSDVKQLSNAFGKIDSSGTKTLLSYIQNIDNSLSSLSEHILNVNKNMSNIGGNTNNTVKQVENITNASKKATSALEDVVRTQAKLNNSKTNTSSGTKDAFQSGTTTSSVEQQAKLQEEINETTNKFNNAQNSSEKFSGKVENDFNEIISIIKTANQNMDDYVEKWKLLKQMGRVGDNAFSAKFQKNNGQTEDWYFTKNDSGTYDVANKSLTTDYKNFEKIIISAENKLRDLEAQRNIIISKSPNASTDGINKQITYQRDYVNLLDQTAQYLRQNNETLLQGAQIENARNKAMQEYYLNKETKDDIKNASQLASDEQKRFTNITQTNRALNRQQILIDEIEKTYSKTANLDLDRAVSSHSDLAQLEQKKTSIQSLLNQLNNQGRNSSNENEFLQLEKLIAEYKQLAKDKLKANNPSKQELGGQDLQVLLSQQVSQYNQLIAKAEKYGDATANVVQKLKDERNIIASMNSDNIYVPKSGLTFDNYYQARDNYKINKAEFNSYETDIKKFEKEWAKLVEIDNAISNTQALLNSLKVPSGFEGSFNNVKSTVESLNKDLENEQITLTEYSSQVKSAFNGFNNSVGEKQTQVWNELNNSLNRYATLQKRIASGNAFSTDEKEASELLNKIYDLKRSDVLSTENIKDSSERLTQIRQTVEDIKRSAKENTLDSMQSVIDKYQKVFNQRSITPADFNQSDTYKKALVELSSSIKTLEEYKASLSGIDEITDEQKVHIEQLTRECEKCANAFKAMDSSEKGSNEASRYKEVDKLSKYLKENTRLSKEAKQQLNEYLNQLKSGDPNVNVKEIHTEWLKIAEAERMAGREGKSFLDILSTKSVHGFIGQMQSYLSMYIGFYGIINKIRSTISTVTELDTSLVDLKKTTTMNASELENFYFDSNKVAKQMGVTTKEIIEQASAWSRLGYNTKETSTEMAQLSSQFASISPGMDTDTAQEDLVSIMRAYDVSPSEVKSKIMDKINVLGKTIAQTYSNVWHTQMYVASW